jgi:hypothetical protein
MPTPEELRAAEQKMKAAQAASLDYIDQPNKDSRTQKRLLADLNASMAEFMRLITERMKETE